MLLLFVVNRCVSEWLIGVYVLLQSGVRRVEVDEGLNRILAQIVLVSPSRPVEIQEVVLYLEQVCTVLEDPAKLVPAVCQKLLVERSLFDVADV